MSKSRLLLGILLGAAAGLLYGWLLHPVELVDTTPDSLLETYRMDYVLMVADAYTIDGDLQTALVRLAALGPQDPDQIVITAINYGIDHAFTRSDLESLNTLTIQLRSLPSSPEIQSP